MTRARELSRLGNPNIISADSDYNVGIGSTTPDAKLDVIGIVSATSFYGDGSGLTGVASTDNIITSGIVTITNATDSTSTTTGALQVTGGIGVGLSMTVGGDVSIGGTVTYEDVTNIDSVGIITARSGIEIGASGVGGTITSVGNVEFAGVTTARSGIEIGASGVGGTITSVGNVEFAGVTTSKGNLNVGSAITAYAATGIVSATAFYGSGANLTGISVDSTKIETGNTKVETIDTGSDGHVKVTTEGTERLRVGEASALGSGAHLIIEPDSGIALRWSTQYQLLTYANAYQIYISDSGDDTTGDGTSSSPWRSLKKALDQVPKVLMWNCYIEIQGSTFTDPAAAYPYLRGISGPGSLYIRKEGASGQVEYTKSQYLTIEDCHSRIYFYNIDFITLTGSTGFKIERCNYIKFDASCSLEYQGNNSAGWGYQSGMWALSTRQIEIRMNVTLTSSSAGWLGGAFVFESCPTVYWDGDLTKSGAQFTPHGIALTNGSWIYLSGDITNFAIGLSMGVNHYGNSTRVDGIIQATTISDCVDGIKLWRRSTLQNYSSSFSNNSSNDINSTDGFLV